MHETDKRAAGEAAAEEVVDDMLVGLGTGTTAAYAIEAIGRRVRAGLRIDAVATSRATEAAATAQGIAVRDLAGVARVDLTIDGADEIDDRLWAIKGGGGAMVREKLVAAASDRMIAIVDASKVVSRIGAVKLPIEVLPFAAAFVEEAAIHLGAATIWRQAGSERYRSDQGNPILDASFGEIPDPRALALALDALPGVVGHGLFLSEIDVVYVAQGDAVTRLERPADDR